MWAGVVVLSEPVIDDDLGLLHDLLCSVITQIAVFRSIISKPTNSLITQCSSLILYGNDSGLLLRLQSVTGNVQFRPRYGVSQLEHDHCRESADGEEDPWASDTARVNAAPILEAGEAVLGPVSPPVVVCIMQDRCLASALRREAGGDLQNLSGRCGTNRHHSPGRRAGYGIGLCPAVPRY